MPNILITTLGTSWQIVPELYGFTNPQQLDLYQHHPQLGVINQARSDNHIEPVSAIWIITTAGMPLDILKQWALGIGVPLKIWWPQDVDEIATAAENTRMADLIYRVVFHGTKEVGQGSLYLSLAGGRKTMSAEMQQAGLLFGCAALLHVVDRRPTENQLVELNKPQTFLHPLPPEMASLYQPLVIMPAQPANVALQVNPPICQKDEPLQDGGEVAAGRLYHKLHERLKKAESLLYNFSSQIDDQHHQASFHGLYSLSPAVIQRLTTERIAADSARRHADLAWLQQLPKADLHCHLGGVLDAHGMISVAASLATEVTTAIAESADFAGKIEVLERLVKSGDACAIRAFLREQCDTEADLFKVPRTWHATEPVGVCGFLQAFADKPQLLDLVIYDELHHPQGFVGIDINRYESLGDLQGSGLLQHEATIRAVCAKLKQHLQEENISYLELRCSPNNYTRGGLSARRVVEILLDELVDDSFSDIRLLFIASRHRKLSEALLHVELAEEMLEGCPEFRRCFVGFDLAGDEQFRSPAQMRSIFMPLLGQCIPTTIHAGENQDVQNIWEAVYELSADRIGHGLTLNEDLQLLRRFVERRIAIEMCPSSNFQIVGFTDHMLDIPGKRYPLQQYLEAGLRVTVNTDNPGISRTTLSNEFYKAASMTYGGMTRWQILQLVRNSFQAAFCRRETRRHLLRKSEKSIVEQLTQFRGIQ